MRYSPAFWNWTLVAAIFALTTPSLSAQSGIQTHWVSTWSTAPVAQVNRSDAFTLPTTLRQIVHVSLGGSQIRVTLTNELGVNSLNIGGAAVAMPAADWTGGAIQPGSSIALTFNGHHSITVPPGAVAVSDPVKLTLAPLSDLVITLSIPGQKIATLTQHDLALQTNYEAAGSPIDAPTLTDPGATHSYDFLKDVEVWSPQGATVVAFGDSITDGWKSTSGANDTWPDDLANRLQANPATRNLGVINMGISGNRILHDGWGPNALSRFDSAVLAPPGVKYVIILESINDIGVAYSPTNPHQIVTADDLITGISQMAARAHAHGIKVFGATLTPYMGAEYSSSAGNSVRQSVNHWIRTTSQLDGVIDFDKATQDPANPQVYAPAFDCGDHLHPNDAGFRAMAGAIDLNLFLTK
ncbi:MAG: SGNH/GDSL hydrolase family protein [Acidobacteriaceae bacterium]